MKNICLCYKATLGLSTRHWGRKRQGKTHKSKKKFERKSARQQRLQRTLIEWAIKLQMLRIWKIYGDNFKHFEARSSNEDVQLLFFAAFVQFWPKSYFFKTEKEISISGKKRHRQKFVAFKITPRNICVGKMIFLARKKIRSDKKSEVIATTRCNFGFRQ